MPTRAAGSEIQARGKPHVARLLEIRRQTEGIDGFLERTIEGPAIAERIRHDFKGGVRSGVNGTPSFFVNGSLHQDSPATLPLVIDAIIASRT